jgi:hypothetical protein
MMKLSMRRQRGFSMMGALFFLVLAGFFLTIAVKLGPHYMEFMTIRSVMQDVSEDPSLAQAGRKSVLETISDRLYVNNVRNVDPKSFKFQKTTQGYRVSVDYQAQEHLFANVDAVLSFNHEVSVGGR